MEEEEEVVEEGEMTREIESIGSKERKGEMALPLPVMPRGVSHCRRIPSVLA